MNDRPWYLLHWPTWFTLTVLSAALVYRQVVWQVFVADQPGTYIYRYGWPLTYCEVWDFQTTPESPEAEYRQIAIVVNMFTSIIVFAASALLTEQLIRRKGRPIQLSLQTVFGLLGLLAVMLAVWRLKPDLLDAPVPFTFSPPVGPASWAVWCSRLTRIVLIFSVGSTVYVAGQIGIWLLKKCFAFRKRQCSNQ